VGSEQAVGSGFTGRRHLHKLIDRDPFRRVFDRHHKLNQLWVRALRVPVRGPLHLHRQHFRHAHDTLQLRLLGARLRLPRQLLLALDGVRCGRDAESLRGGDDLRAQGFRHEAWRVCVGVGGWVGGGGGGGGSEVGVPGVSCMRLEV
jgi:hypothetical protein